MQIVHVIIGLNGGGAENFLYRLVHNQVLRGKSVTVVSLTDLGLLGNKFLELGVTVNCLGLDGFHRFWFVLLRLRRLLINLQPTIVQSWMYHADFLCSLALLKTNIRHIWSVRCTDIPKGSILTYALMKVCAVLSYFRPDKICYVANAAMLSHHNYGYSKSKSVVIHNGYDFTNFRVSNVARNEIREYFNVPPDTVVFGTLGRFHSDKGQDLFLDAFSNLNVNAMLFLIGTGCVDTNSILVEKIRKLGLEGRVKLLGNQNDVVAFLSALDIYVMPSRTEGFPNALAEAMAIGLPCVATQVGDTEFMSNGNVIMCKPDVSSLTQAITKIYALTGDERNALGHASSIFIRNSFSISNIEKKYSELYCKVVGKE